jgi:hypothetical protein
MAAKKTTKTTLAHAAEPTREPNWNPRRIAIVKAMRTLKAINPQSARTAGEIAKRAGKVDGVDLTGRVDLVKIILDVYRTSELLHNGFASSVRMEGERELRYFLTAKGMKTAFPQKEKAEKPAKKAAKK